MNGRLLAIARKAKSHAPMEEIPTADISIEFGIAGDFRGSSKRRQITVLAIEDWRAAVESIGCSGLPWTTRRANLLVENMALPRRIGARFSIGDVVLEVTEETEPCARMEKARAGLRAALTPEWRGGVCCRVITGGQIAPGAEVKSA